MSAADPTVLTDDDVLFVCDFIREEAAIELDSGKTYLIQARLESLARRRDYANITELMTAFKSPGSKNGLSKDVVDALTTNETFFFRDIHPFVTLKEKIIPDLITERESDRTLNIWCAASSSGQEPYTIAMVLRENFPVLQDWTINFMASDVSSDMLKRCTDARYTRLEINRGLPASLLVKYFEADGAMWKIKNEITDMVRFESVNLKTAWPKMPPLDLVFIRNVLIYFSVETKKEILVRIGDLLSPHGVLFLGTSETTLNLDSSFERDTFKDSTFYRLPGNPD